MPRVRLYPHGNGIFKNFPKRRPQIFGRAPAIHCDITPYRCYLENGPDGESLLVTSRSQHKEILRRHGAVEIGNEAPAFIRESQYLEKQGMTTKDAHAYIKQREEANAPPEDENIRFEWMEPDPETIRGS